MTDKTDMNEYIKNNINGFILAENAVNVEQKPDKIIVRGLLLPKDKISRNGIMYDWESVRKTFPRFVGCSFMYNHRIEEEDKPIGRVTDIQFFETKPADPEWAKIWDYTAERNMGVEQPGAYYEVDVNPNSYYADSILRGDIPNVSLQIQPSNQNKETTDDGLTYTRAEVGSVLEISAVPVGGYMETTLQVAMAENYKRNVIKENEDDNMTHKEHLNIGSVVDVGGKKMKVIRTTENGYIMEYPEGDENNEEQVTTDTVPTQTKIPEEDENNKEGCDEEKEFYPDGEMGKVIDELNDKEAEDLSERVFKEFILNYSIEDGLKNKKNIKFNTNTQKVSLHGQGFAPPSSRDLFGMSHNDLEQSIQIEYEENGERGVLNFIKNNLKPHGKIKKESVCKESESGIWYDDIKKIVEEVGKKVNYSSSDKLWSDLNKILYSVRSFKGDRDLGLSNKEVQTLKRAIKKYGIRGIQSDALKESLSTERLTYDGIGTPNEILSAFEKLSNNMKSHLNTYTLKKSGVKVRISFIKNNIFPNGIYTLKYNGKEFSTERKSDLLYRLKELDYKKESLSAVEKLLPSEQQFLDKNPIDHGRVPKKKVDSFDDLEQGKWLQIDWTRGVGINYAMKKGPVAYIYSGRYGGSDLQQMTRQQFKDWRDRINQHKGESLSRLDRLYESVMKEKTFELSTDGIDKVYYIARDEKDAINQFKKDFNNKQPKYVIYYDSKDRKDLIEKFEVLPKDKAKKKEKFWYYKNGVYIHLSAIPQTYTHSALIYFVSDKKGNEFGQFDNFRDAHKKAKEMEKLDDNERKKFDESFSAEGFVKSNSVYKSLKTALDYFKNHGRSEKDMKDWLINKHPISPTEADKIIQDFKAGKDLKKYEESFSEAMKPEIKNLVKKLRQDLKKYGKVTPINKGDSYISLIGNIPNEFRVKIIKKLMPSANVLNWDDVNYGNIRSNGISLHPDDWIKFMGYNKSDLKESLSKVEKLYESVCREGTWKLGNKRDIQKIVSEINTLARKAYNIVGDDEFMDGLDRAKQRAKDLAKQQKESLSRLDRLHESVMSEKKRLGRFKF